MKYLFVICAILVASSKPSIEPMIYEEEIYGFVVRDGIRHYEEDGKTVYYIEARTVKKLILSK